MDYDLTLILDGIQKGVTVELRTWSQVIANASPYFRIMLSADKFAEGATLRRDGELKIPLPDTDAKAMRILCDVFALRSSRVPVGDITSQDLFNVAVLVDRFECLEAVRPWNNVWLEQEHIKKEFVIHEQISMKELAAWICICHSLGCPDRSRAHADALLQGALADQLEQSSDPHFIHLPPSIINRVRTTRVAVAEKLRDIMIEQLQTLEKGETCQKPAPDDEYDEWTSFQVIAGERFYCSSVLLGAAILAFDSKLGPSWRTEPWRGSISEMRRRSMTAAGRLAGPKWIIEEGPRTSKARVSTHGQCALDLALSSRINDAVRDLVQHAE